MKKLFIILLFSIIAAAPLAANAEEKLGIVATVGDSAITNKDLLHRLKIMIISLGASGDAATVRRIRPEALRALVDERMFTEEAKKAGYEVTDQQINEAVASLESQNNMKDGGLMGMLNSNDVPSQAMREKLTADISQAYLVAREVTPKIKISDDEVNDFLKAESQVTTSKEYLVNEIVIPVNLPAEEDSALALARELKEKIRIGEDFAELAKQHSKSPSSRNGGDVGWLDEKQLPVEILKVMEEQGLNKILGPIRSVEGYYLVIVNDERVVSSAGNNDLVELRQFSLAPKSEADKSAKAKVSALNNIKEACFRPQDYAKANGMNVQSYSRTRVGDLPSGVRNILKDLDTAKFSKALFTPIGYAKFLICERIQKSPDDVTDAQREQARNQLRLRKSEVAAKKYFRDLRLKTNIDVRI